MATQAFAFTGQQLPTPKQFVIDTDNGWSRSQLRRIDRGLSIAKSCEANPQLYVPALGNLIDECRVWMEGKEIKFSRKAPTRSYLKRRKAINSLMSVAMLHLKYFAFEARKRRGEKSNLVSMKPGFGRERTEFESSKKSVPGKGSGVNLDPHSSSYVVAGAEDIKKGHTDVSALSPRTRGLAFIPIDQMTEADFMWIATDLQCTYGVDLTPGMHLPRVHYVRKQERISSNMLIALPSAGGQSGTRRTLLFKETAHHPYSSAGAGVRKRSNPGEWDIPAPADIYAIDKYGNIIVAPNEQRHDNGVSSADYRHSSLNAGNSVICAGRIRILDGIVTHIDNWSGHYRPSELDLARAVACLIKAHDLDLASTIVTLFFAGPPKQRPISQLISMVPGSFFASF